VSLSSLFNELTLAGSARDLVNKPCCHHGECPATNLTAIRDYHVKSDIKKFFTSPIGGISNLHPFFYNFFYPFL